MFVTAGSGGLDVPHGLAFHNGDLYVTGLGSHNVIRYNGTTGAFVEVFAEDGLGNPGDPGPVGMTFGPQGDLYVALGPINNVLRYNGVTGALIDEFVAAQSGGLQYAVSVQFDPSGNLLVASRDTNQVLVYQGPADTNPGEFIDDFEPGERWTIREARDINNFGQITGNADLSGVGNVPFRYTPSDTDVTIGTFENLASPGMTQAVARSINNDGDVAGHFAGPFFEQSLGNYHPFLWTPETGPQDLGDLGNVQFTTAINDRTASGDVQVLGSVEPPGLNYRAWRYDTATGNILYLDPLNNSGTQLTFGLDLNNFGDITGSSTTTKKSRGKQGFSDRVAIIYTDADGMQALGTLEGLRSVGLSINDFGDVVGDTSDRSGAPSFAGAFVYTAETGIFALEPQIIDLPAALSGTTEAARINITGQISGPRNSNVSEAYLITPLP